MRTNGTAPRIFPRTSATALSCSVFPSIPRISNGPNRVGNLARATIRMPAFDDFAILRDPRARSVFLRGIGPRIISGVRHTRRFTSALRLANVAAAAKAHENAYIWRRFAAQAAAARGRGGVDLRVARAFGYVSQSA